MIYYQKGYYVSMAFLKFFQPFFSHFSVYLFSAISQRHFRLFLLFYVFFHLCFSDVLFYPVSYSDGFLFR